MTFILRPIWLEADLNWGRFDWGRYDWSRFDLGQLGPIWLEIVNMILKFQTFSNIKNKKTVTPEAEDINTNYSNQDVD